MSSDQGTQQYTYAQPSRPTPIDLQQSDFYTYDQALPFSPHTHTNAEASGSTHTHTIPPDLAFTAYPTEGPSPTSAMYGAIGRPMSARWDRSNLSTNQMLPPSSEMAFDGLPFDEGGLLLHDFEAALAHADDMANGW